MEKSANATQTVALAAMFVQLGSVLVHGCSGKPGSFGVAVEIRACDPHDDGRHAVKDDLLAHQRAWHGLHRKINQIGWDHTATAQAMPTRTPCDNQGLPDTLPCL